MSKAILVVDVPDDYAGSKIDVEIYCHNDHPYCQDRIIHEIYVNKLRRLPECINDKILGDSND